MKGILHGSVNLLKNYPPAAGKPCKSTIVAASEPEMLDKLSLLCYNSSVIRKSKGINLLIPGIIKT